MHCKNTCISVYPTRWNVTQLYLELYLETAVHILGGTCTHHQERIQLYLQHLIFVTPLLLCAAILEEMELPVPTLPRQRHVAVTVWHITDAVDTMVCAPDDGWRYYSKHVKQFPDIINCIILHLIRYILEYQIQISLSKLNLSYLTKHIGYKPRSLTHCGRVTQICVFTLQLCRTGGADLRF